MWRARWLFLVILGLATPSLGESAPGSMPPDESEGSAILGSPSAFDLSAESSERIRVDAGTSLHRAPAQRSEILAHLDIGMELDVFQCRKGWCQVRFESFKGWIPLDPTAESAVESAAEWAPRRPPPPQLARARAMVGAGGNERRLGSFSLYTDSTDSRLLDELSALAAQLPKRFAERYGLGEPSVENASVVLFAEESSYKTFIEDQGGLVRDDPKGHAIRELAVLSIANRHPEEGRALLAHELTHVLTYLTLGPGLPPWLVEGIAEDMAYCRHDRHGRIHLGSLSRWKGFRRRELEDRSGDPLVVTEETGGGGVLALERLRRDWDEVPRLEVLVELLPGDFSQADRRQLYYSKSAFFVRYLVDEKPPFRDYLRGLQRGDSADSATFLSSLGTTWDELERAFELWIWSPSPRKGKSS